MIKPNRLLFDEMTREQLRAIAPDTTVVLPLGATEQHGPHLPAGTDLFTVESLARAAAERASSEIAITVAPALPFGSSDHHLIFGATLSLRTETYYRVLTDLLRSLVTDGFRRIFLLNGHCGNHVGPPCPEEVRKVQNLRRAILFLLGSRPWGPDFPRLVLIVTGNWSTPATEHFVFSGVQ